MKNGIESLGRVRFQGAILLAVAFIVGALAGVAGDRAVLQREPQPPPFGPPRAGGGFLPAPLEHLDLSDDQRRQIVDILERRRPRTDSVLEEALPQLRAIMDSIREELRAVLTPEQRERLGRESPRFLSPRGLRRYPGPRGRQRPGGSRDTPSRDPTPP